MGNSFHKRLSNSGNFETSPPSMIWFSEAIGTRANNFWSVATIWTRLPNHISSHRFKHRLDIWRCWYQVLLHSWTSGYWQLRLRPPSQPNHPIGSWEFCWFDKSSFSTQVLDERGVVVVVVLSRISETGGIAELASKLRAGDFHCFFSISVLNKIPTKMIPPLYDIQMFMFLLKRWLECMYISKLNVTNTVDSTFDEQVQYLCCRKDYIRICISINEELCLLIVREVLIARIAYRIFVVYIIRMN